MPARYGPGVYFTSYRPRNQDDKILKSIYDSGDMAALDRWENLKFVFTIRKEVCYCFYIALLLIQQVMTRELSCPVQSSTRQYSARHATVFSSPYAFTLRVLSRSYSHVSNICHMLKRFISLFMNTCRVDTFLFAIVLIVILNSTVTVRYVSLAASGAGGLHGEEGCDEERRRNLGGVGARRTWRRPAPPAEHRAPAGLQREPPRRSDRMLILSGPYMYTTPLNVSLLLH